jgi:hypothetical protein
MDHFALRVAIGGDLGAWIAKLKAENVSSFSGGAALHRRRLARGDD